MKPYSLIELRGAACALLLTSGLALFGLVGCGEVDGASPWDGTLRSGVQAMSEEAEGGRIEAALEIADRMLAPGRTARLRERLNRVTRGVSESVLSPVTSALDLVGVSALRPVDRAEIEYARAAALLAGAARGDDDAPGLLQRADAALERARGAAPGEVRASAVYNQGTLDLLAAESVRATIPEIAGAGAAGPTAPPDPNAPADEDAPDPLEVARGFYLMARAHLVEYLTEQNGADAAANVELVIRRLAELDEIDAPSDPLGQQVDVGVRTLKVLEQRFQFLQRVAVGQIFIGLAGHRCWSSFPRPASCWSVCSTRLVIVPSIVVVRRTVPSATWSTERTSSPESVRVMVQPRLNAAPGS